MFLARFSTENPVLVNLLAVFVFLSGLVIYFTMPREIFPDFSLDAIRITTRYSGASPEEVEKLVTVKIEDAIAGVDGIDAITSTSQEGLSSIVVTLKKDADLVRALNDIQSEIEALEDFPEEADDPRVQEVKTVFPVITASLYGSVAEQKLKELAKDLKDELLDIPGVSGVQILGLRERQIWVEVRPEALEQYHLTLDDIRQALASRNLNLPGGSIKTGQHELLLRTLGEVEGVQELSRLPLRSDPYGNTLTLDRVATVREHFEEATTLGRFNGQRAINLQVTKEKGGNAITIADQVRKRARAYEALLPPGVHIDVFNDFSVYIKNRLRVLKSNGIVGLFLVLVTLCVFLHWRVALLTALGIPVAFMGAFLLMEWYGISLNMLSMFSLIVALGMIVDDAIIIGENVYRYVEAGFSPKEAAIRGTGEVLLPVFASTATTVAAFLPMLLMTGTFGKFMANIPVVVSFALLASLFEALFVLPSHLADFLSPRRLPP
ncbi:MAG: efflux RND transporter permease subunit, partial [Nitrospinota bacterium]